MLEVAALLDPDKHVQFQVAAVDPGVPSGRLVATTQAAIRNQDPPDRLPQDLLAHPSRRQLLCFLLQPVLVLRFV